MSVLGSAVLCAVGIVAGSTRVASAQAPTAAGANAAVVEKSADAMSKLTLLKKEQTDVNDDGVMDTVAYFDSDGDNVVDGEAIDIGSTGHVSVLAIRADADNDGRNDDWLVVNADTEEVRAALVDSDDDGQADAIAYADGHRTPLEGSDPTEIRAAFSY